VKFSIWNKSAKSEIQKLFTRTFSDSEGPSEGDLVGRLVLELMTKTDEKDILGFVAIEDERIVGCIFFTRLLFDAPVDALLLSPVAVHSDYQGKATGQNLVKFGLGQLKEKGVKLVFTYGDPDFYSRVGFEPVSEALAKAPFELSRPEGWLCQSLDGSVIESLPGRARCVKAFNNSEYW